MKEKIHNRVEEKISSGYHFPVGEYISEGWNIYKKHAGGFIAFLMLSFLLNGLLGIIPVAGFLIATFILSPALNAGYYIVADRIVSRADYAFADFLKGFEYLGPLALSTIVMYLIIGLAFTPSLYALNSAGIIGWYQEVLADPLDPALQPPDLSGKTSLILFLNIIPIVYLVVGYAFTKPFIVFYQLGFWEALETSRRLITSQWFSVFMLFLAFFGLFMLIYLPVALLIMVSPGLFYFAMLGILALLPVVYCTVFVAFADVTDLHTPEDEDDQIIDHLIE